MNKEKRCPICQFDQPDTYGHSMACSKYREDDEFAPTDTTWEQRFKDEFGDKFHLGYMFPDTEKMEAALSFIHTLLAQHDALLIQRIEDHFKSIEPWTHIGYSPKKFVLAQLEIIKDKLIKNQ